LARYAVVLDACVLVPIALADTLLRIAERELYRPLWSGRILAEAADAVLEVHPDIPPEQVGKRFAVKDETFEDARVEGAGHIRHQRALDLELASCFDSGLERHRGWRNPMGARSTSSGIPKASTSGAACSRTSSGVPASASMSTKRSGTSARWREPAVACW